ncbi:MAG: AmmeMemoRadiSam system radical SAM enzyme, partial [Bacteroidales bacterium]|nr:AmmeMemoRadiSam system radical SAM enzyme [Bacteroidales bacterium]
MKEALFYRAEEGGLRCTLCPHLCLVKEGSTGTCRVRRNAGGRLVADTYGRVSSIHTDPVEKKPLYHYFPSRNILSMGTAGCNLHCRYCQNCQISQSSIDELPLLSHRSPEEVVRIALDTPGNLGIAFTYNEPTVWLEFMLDIAILAKEAGLKTVAVTNGFILPEPLDRMLEVTDAFNVDLKGFTEEFYRKITFASLGPVLDALVSIQKAGKHLELTSLIVPGLNDNQEIFRDMISWICDKLGKNTPLHLSRYFPMHRMNLPPTPLDTLMKLSDIARERMPYIYLGNVGY